jgi:hypothetical protein
MKQPLSCIFLNVARLSADLTGIFLLSSVCGVKMVTGGAKATTRAKCPLFGHVSLFSSASEVRHALAGRRAAAPMGLIGRKVFERDQGEAMLLVPSCGMK